ncbi:MAG: hypothetical protein GY782_03565 [Gammaproteobacteria bacterium]|nr:hypothetical protein [Gammaproteobacteria bacterium]
MSDSLENMADTQNEVTQPVDVVVTETEEVSSPQTDDVETEIYVETEGDQEQPNDAQRESAKLQAAVIKKDKKRKEERDARIAAEQRVAQLEEQISQLSGDVHQIKRGPRPSMYDFETEDEFIEAFKEWEKPAPKVSTKAPSQEVEASDNQVGVGYIFGAEDYLQECERELAQKVPDYYENESSLIDAIKARGGNDGTMIALTNIAKQAGVNIANAKLGLSKNPRLLDDLNEAAGSNSPFAIAEVLRSAASKVQTRKRKPIDTQPEPTINSSGPIDNSTAAVQKARDAWRNETNPERQAVLWQQYQAAKKSTK